MKLTKRINRDLLISLSLMIPSIFTGMENLPFIVWVLLTLGFLIQLNLFFDLKRIEKGDFNE